MRAFYCLLLLAGACLVHVSTLTVGPPTPADHAPFSLSRLRRGSEQDFWSVPSINYYSGGREAGEPIMDIPANDVPLGSDWDLDKIQVASSAIRVLPRNKVRSKRQLRKPRAEDMSLQEESINRATRNIMLEKPRPKPKPPADNSTRRKRDTLQSWTKPRVEDMSLQEESINRATRNIMLEKPRPTPEPPADNSPPWKRETLQSWTKPRAEDIMSLQEESINRSRRRRQSDEFAWKRPRLMLEPPEDNSLRRKRETLQSWRRPRQHQFVTNKADRLPPPTIVRVYPPVDRSERFYDRDYRKGQRRIIYYANLPEIVRPPVQWYNTRGDYYDPSRQTYPSSSPTYSSSPYPSPSENEITRVQSNIIDVTNSRYNGYSSTPKFTIIDVEPPYNYPSYNRRPPVRYDSYPSVQYSPNRFYNDVRTPPYRDHSYFPQQNFRPDSSLEPVKLQLPTTDRPASDNSTVLPANTTRFLPDNLPVSLRSLSKFVT